MKNGVFSDEIKKGFIQILDYFGQNPIIVRSSSFLEDGYGNAFAGKYESVFCVNRGSLEERLEAFEEAVTKVPPSSEVYQPSKSYPDRTGTGSVP